MRLYDPFSIESLLDFLKGEFSKETEGGIGFTTLVRTRPVVNEFTQSAYLIVSLLYWW